MNHSDRITIKTGMSEKSRSRKFEVWKKGSDYNSLKRLLTYSRSSHIAEYGISYFLFWELTKA